MILKEIEQRVKKISELQDDFESAHAMEDVLHIDFIKYISETGNMKQKLMALEILKTEAMDFPRYTA